LSSGRHLYEYEVVCEDLVRIVTYLIFPLV